MKIKKRKILCRILNSIDDMTYNSDDIDDTKIDAYNQGFYDCKLQAKRIIREHVCDVLGRDIPMGVEHTTPEDIYICQRIRYNVISDDAEE